ncbi:phosphotransferase [Nocardioides sp. CER19]|uniref:phosphotransferase enzyme family protein n=1 Tax=Nocardioides sp. CER19 TaxID=3038538 RepID=UPI0024478DA8|nr:phosphotransferase [Nocardioides sp. CER19]MDH2414370.1 phosphotransferase [Nocardioides sp. CER19]
MTKPSEFEALPESDQAARLAQLVLAAGAHWDGGFADVELVKYRENAVFSARRPDGARVAVRVHRHGYHSDAALHSELAWMRALGETGDVAVPPVLAASDGRLVVEVTHDEVPLPRQVSVLGWLNGVPAGTSEDGVALDDEAAARLYHHAGALAARLHSHATSWAPPEGFTRHAWDADGLIGETPLWGRFWEYDGLDDDQRRLLLEARSRAALDLAALGAGPHNYGLIHADLVPENLLDHDGRLELIDFDDAGYGWFLFELATALYFNLGRSCYEDVRQSLLTGYRSARPLSAEDEASLPLFLFLRGTTYLGWVQSRPGTETSRNLGPMLRTMACAAAESYLSARATGKVG